MCRTALRSILLLAVVLPTACGRQQTPEKQPAPAADKPAAGSPTSAAPSPASPPPATAPGATASPAPAPGAAPLPPARPLPAELPAVVARVNGEAIERAELEGAVQMLEQRAGQPVPAERRANVFRDALDQLVSYRLLEQESRARRIEIPDAEVTAQLDEIQKQFQSPEAFNSALAGRKMSVADFRNDVRKEMAISKLLEAEVGKTISITDKEIQDFHAKNPERFKQPETVRASHILVRVDPTSDPAAVKHATAEIGELLKKARAGADFAALAKEHSDDSSAPQGGDLGFFSIDQMVPEFAKAAFQLKPGEISDVVRTQFGFHIIKAVERQPARTVPLPEVRDQVMQFLTMQARELGTDAYVQRLKAKSKIEVYI
jgi:peptidyl-prolyl cis-trans isomerase C